MNIEDFKKILEKDEIDIKTLITQFFGEKAAIEFINMIKGTS